MQTIFFLFPLLFVFLPFFFLDPNECRELHRINRSELENFFSFISFHLLMICLLCSHLSLHSYNVRLLVRLQRKTEKRRFFRLSELKFNLICCFHGIFISAIDRLRLFILSWMLCDELLHNICALCVSCAVFCVLCTLYTNRSLNVFSFPLFKRQSSFDA